MRAPQVRGLGDTCCTSAQAIAQEKLEPCYSHFLSRIHYGLYSDPLPENIEASAFRSSLLEGSGGSASKLRLMPLDGAGCSGIGGVATQARSRLVFASTRASSSAFAALATRAMRLAAAAYRTMACFCFFAKQLRICGV